MSGQPPGVLDLALPACSCSACDGDGVSGSLRAPLTAGQLVERGRDMREQARRHAAQLEGCEQGYAAQLEALSSQQQAELERRVQQLEVILGGAGRMSIAAPLSFQATTLKRLLGRGWPAKPCSQSFLFA